MNVATSGVIQAKAQRWGFAANDPRVSATFTGVSTGLTTVAIAVAGGAIATVGWPGILIGAGVAALVSGSVSLAVDGAYKWTFNPDKTVTLSGTVTNPGITGTKPLEMVPVVYGGAFTSSSINRNLQGAVIVGVSSNARDNAAWMCQAMDTVNPSAPHGTTKVSDFGGGTVGYACYSSCSFYGCGEYGAYAYVHSAGAPTSSPSGSAVDGRVYEPQQIPPETASPVVAASKIPVDVQQKPISSALLAAAANAAWKANTSKDSIPWSSSDPITEADVEEWRSANPSQVPTVADFTASVAPSSSSTSSVPMGTFNTAAPSGGTSGGTSTAPVPTATPTTTAPTTQGTGTEINWGPNPNVAAPALETTPTAAAILGPLVGLMPDLKNFAVPSHSGVCPTASFSVYQHDYVMSSHCTLFDNNRALIEGAMMLVFGLSSVFIVLKA
jgi:hypothetical protein